MEVKKFGFNNEKNTETGKNGMFGITFGTEEKPEFLIFFRFSHL